MGRLNLADALASNDLESFVRQAEADDVGPADRQEFEARLGQFIKAPQPEDRTSRSPARDDSAGT
jgi:hypothetical protein